MSYARADEQFVRELVENLRDDGFGVWIDRDIPAGVPWDEEVQKAVDAATTMIVVLSPRSAASNEVTNEWSQALDRRHLVIPVLIEPCEIHFRLKRLQRIDFSVDYAGAREQLVERLRARSTAARAPVLAGASAPRGDPADNRPPRESAPRPRGRKPSPRSADWVKLGLLVLLLATAVGLALAFGIGLVHQNAVSNTVAWSILGLAASLLTWGLLDSAGSIRGTVYGLKIRLTGAVLPLVLMVGLGLWQEQRMGLTTIKVKFVDPEKRPARFTGRLRLEAGTWTPEQPVNDGLAAFDCPATSVHQTATLTLAAKEYELVDPSARYELDPQHWLEVGVRPIRQLEPSRVSGTFTFNSRPVSGIHVFVAGTNCDGDTNEHGYFEISCAGLMFPKKLRIELPSSSPIRPCIREFQADAGAGNDFRLTECLAKDAGVDAPPPRDAGLLRPDAGGRPDCSRAERQCESEAIRDGRCSGACACKCQEHGGRLTCRPSCDRLCKTPERIQKEWTGPCN